MKEVHCTLNQTLKELEITRNRLAVEAKVRPNTINDLANNNAKAINFKTLESILRALEVIAQEKGSYRSYNINDVITFSQLEK